jgi:hypothetical protein
MGSFQCLVVFLILKFKIFITKELLVLVLGGGGGGGGGKKK